MSDANALIMGSSVPSCTFPEMGRTYEGTITALDVKQARKFGTQDLDFWPDGQPKMQAVVTLKTTEHDPEIENDNGMRRLYVASKGMRAAIAAAVKKAGETEIKVGGTLGVRYVRDDPNGKNPANLPKLYGVKYEPPPAGSEYTEPEPDDYGEYSPEPF